MANDESPELLALKAELEILMDRRARLVDFDSFLKTNLNSFKNSFFYKLIGLIDSEVSRAQADSVASSISLEDQLDKEDKFIGFRKRFHKSVGRRFVTYALPILLILGFSWVTDLLDSLAFATPWGLLIYPLIGFGAFGLVLGIVLRNQRKKGKLLWPAKRVAKWLVLSGILALSISFWPVVSIAIFWILRLAVWPSKFVAVVALSALFLIVFLQAILKYHFDYRDYFDKLQVLAVRVKWASEASVRAHHELARLRIQRQQVIDWLVILSRHAYTPWRLLDAPQADSKWNLLASNLPISMHVGQAVDVKSEAGSWSIQMSRMVNSTIESLTEPGWRSRALDTLIEESEKFRGTARAIDWEALDLDTPVSPNGSRAELLRLLQDEDFLGHIGDLNVESKRRDVERSLLDAAELRVTDISAKGPQGSAESEYEWDQFLSLPMGDLSFGSPALAKFAFTEKLQLDGHHANVESWVFVPSRIAKRIAESGQKIPKQTKLISSSRNEGHEFDLIVRIDVSGITTGIPLGALRVASFETYQETESLHLETCVYCGSPHCPRLTNPSLTSCGLSAI